MSRTELWVRPEVIDLVRDKFRGQSIALPGGGEIVFGVCDAVERREATEQTLGLSSEQAARIADQLEHAGLGPVVSS